MTEAMRTAGFAVIAAMAAFALRAVHRQAGAAVALAAGLMLFFSAITQGAGAVEALRSLSRQAGVGDGTVTLGIIIPRDGTFTISAPRCQFQNIVLIDNETGIETDLTSSSYTFTANAGTYNNRIRPVLPEGLDYTIEYLGDKATCVISDNHVVAHIDVSNNELVLLDNISFYDNDGEIGININTNTKSSSVIALKVGDSYTDGELKMFLKNRGYSCK